MEQISCFCLRLEKITEENDRLAQELKFKEEKVHSLQKRFVSCVFLQIFPGWKGRVSGIQLCIVGIVSMVV